MPFFWPYADVPGRGHRCVALCRRGASAASAGRHPDGLCHRAEAPVGEYAHAHGAEREPGRPAGRHLLLRPQRPAPAGQHSDEPYLRRAVRRGAAERGGFLAAAAKWRGKRPVPAHRGDGAPANRGRAHLGYPPEKADRGPLRGPGADRL